MFVFYCISQSGEEKVKIEKTECCKLTHLVITVEPKQVLGYSYSTNHEGKKSNMIYLHVIVIQYVICHLFVHEYMYIFTLKYFIYKFT